MPAIKPHRTPVTPAKTATAQVHNLTCQMAARDGITYEKARDRVSLEDPELFRQYLAEQKGKAKDSHLMKAVERLGAERTAKVL